jgi:hypothetical protein
VTKRDQNTSNNRQEKNSETVEGSILASGNVPKATKSGGSAQSYTRLSLMTKTDIITRHHWAVAIHNRRRDRWDRHVCAANAQPQYRVGSFRRRQPPTATRNLKHKKLTSNQPVIRYEESEVEGILSSMVEGEREYAFAWSKCGTHGL